MRIFEWPCVLIGTPRCGGLWREPYGRGILPQCVCKSLVYGIGLENILREGVEAVLFVGVGPRVQCDVEHYEASDRERKKEIPYKEGM